jgi:hypothetical protein
VTQSFLWIGSESKIPFFKKTTGEMVIFASVNLMDSELLKWVKTIKKNKSNDTPTPYFCEKGLNEDSLAIERYIQLY